MSNQPPKQRKKPGPPKGSPRRGGKQKGTKNKRTIERERVAQLEQERLRLVEEAKTRTAVDQAVADQRKLMKDIGFDLTTIVAGLAVYYRPDLVPDGRGGMMNLNPNYDEAKFRFYTAQALAGARDFASYESPKLSAVMVAQQVVNHVTVTGGMPDEFAPPVPGTVDFQPGDIISAEDGAPDKRVVAGEIVTLPLKAAG